MSRFLARLLGSFMWAQPANISVILSDDYLHDVISLLCHESYWHGCRVSARSHSSPETALFHVGFRCAYDARS
ncbi:MAG: hypothetical protein AAGI08_14265 [Bacteroidota bacterium]